MYISVFPRAGQTTRMDVSVNSPGSVKTNLSYCKNYDLKDKGCLDTEITFSYFDPNGSVVIKPFLSIQS